MSGEDSSVGDLIVMLLWIYYSALIVLFGAEFTETWAEKRGEGLGPGPLAPWRSSVCEAS